MPDYVVLWAADVEDVAGPREAAQQARDLQTAPGTWATVFDVKDVSNGEVYRVDLLGDEEDDYILYPASEHAYRLDSEPGT